MQRNCIFPGRYAPLTYYEDVHKTHFRILRSILQKLYSYINSMLQHTPSSKRIWLSCDVIMMDISSESIVCFSLNHGGW